MIYPWISIWRPIKAIILCIICLPFLQSHWLGNKYILRGPEGNDIHKTNVPNLRIAFRHEVSFLFLVKLLSKLLICLRQLTNLWLADMDRWDAVCILRKCQDSRGNRPLTQSKCGARSSFPCRAVISIRRTQFQTGVRKNHSCIILLHIPRLVKSRMGFHIFF